MKVQELLGKTVSIRSEPRATATKMGAIDPFSTITAPQIVDDLDHRGDPRYKWLELGAGIYVNYIYPPNGLRFRWLDAPGTTTFPFDLFRVKWDF